MNFIADLQLQYILRMVVASILGILIGFERKNRAKEAGIRTHCIVACAAALMMIVSKYAYDDILGGAVKLDPSRVASSIVSGVGFLGAGMIFVHKQTVTGLTTAAGIWATSGIGMAIGAGMYNIGIAGTMIIVFMQIILHSNISFFKPTVIKFITVNNVCEDDFQDKITKMLSSHKVLITNTQIAKNVTSSTKDYVFTVEIPSGVSEDKLIDLLDYNCTIAQRNTALIKKYTD